MTDYPYDRITRDNVCDRLLAVGDDTCSVEDSRQMIVVDVSGMTENEVDWMESAGVVPDGHRFDRLPDLILDAYRFRAMVMSMEQNRTECPSCAVCDFIHDTYTPVDPVSAVLVEWNVMGDPRPYVLVCPECSVD